jgi:alkanesulfonate monooxygenase SsuD/methylene tetrahydromethanopterin reductase-like flavin-dependent oxidoreductase (luciferase family)
VARAGPAGGGASLDLVGSPDAVAAQMAEATEKVGGDGFLFSMPNVSRRTTAESADGLHPRCSGAG